MPLSDIQAAVLKAIAKNRSLDSYIAGATVIHAEARSPRVSQDVDIFHDDVGMVTRSARLDAESLKEAGFSVEWLEQFPAFFRAVVRRGTEVVEIDWAADSAYRFFPLEPDPVFGFRLHPIDAATNADPTRSSYGSRGKAQSPRPDGWQRPFPPRSLVACISTRQAGP